MLQPRIPLQRFCNRPQTWAPLLRRSYVQFADPAPPQATYTPLAQSDPVTTKVAVNLRRYKPRTPGLRHLIRPVNDHLWKGRPLFKLTIPKKGQGKGGRNHTGHVVVRHRGGGAKRRIRTVDFLRAESGRHLVERIEHDPGRTAHIALVKNQSTGEQSYILAAEGMRAGDVVQSFRSGIPDDMVAAMGGQVDQGVLASKTALRGNCLPLGMIPVGTPIFNIAASKESIAKFCRCAGTHGVIIGKGEDTVQKEMMKAVGEGGNFDMTRMTPEQLKKFERAAAYVTVKLASGEIRLIHKEAVATIGIASNVNFKYRQLGKAGRKRWLGIRPTVRGLAMNACDHPHGGGRGKSKGNRDPMSPWGVHAKSGYKTRPKNKINKLVVTHRPRNQGKRRRGYA